MLKLRFRREEMPNALIFEVEEEEKPKQVADSKNSINRIKQSLSAKGFSLQGPQTFAGFDPAIKITGPIEVKSEQTIQQSIKKVEKILADDHVDVTVAFLKKLPYG